MTPRYPVGARVAVKDLALAGHYRTPVYIRGKTGVIERVCGAFPNPEETAYGKSGLPARVLYRVRFDQRDVWPGYRGAGADSLDIEIYEHWLAPA